MAWTWKTYIDSAPEDRDPDMIARMPMTKAGTRALDAINEFVLSMEPDHDIKEFAVGGGSKRGWTAWSVAATDRRVTAVTPMVMSLLNFNDTLQAHYRNLGGWTWVFNDYWELNLTQHFHDDIATNWENGIWNYEDMFRYKERLELIPKLLVSATGDEFFLPTDSHTWWDQMGGQKWIMMTPNAEHSLIPWHRRIGEGVATWLMLLLETSMPNVPQMNWLRGYQGTAARILLNVDQVPDEVTAWWAETWRNDTRRDFRLAVGYPPFIHPVIWQRKEVNTIGPGNYDVEIENNGPGYTAVFIECVWTRFIQGLRLHLTTEIQVTPAGYPFPSCYGIECWGTLT
jgi:PhoPQ-activated pathogenicity-related protein